jgi:hypothetical protein
LTKALRIFNTSKSCDTISLSVESVEDFEDFISMMMDISYGKFLSKPIAKGSENIEVRNICRHWNIEKDLRYSYSGWITEATSLFQY